MLGFKTLGLRCPTLGWLAVGLLSWACTTTVSAQATNTDDAARRQFAAAAALQNREQFELAADEWQKFVAQFPQNERAPLARHYLGLCQLKAKQYPAAIKSLEKLVADAPKIEELEPSYLYLGLAQYYAGQAGAAAQLVDAQKTFAAQLQKFPQGKFLPQAVYYQGEAAYAAGKKEDAVKAYQLFASRFPKDPLLSDALYALGVTLEELGQPQSAGAAYDQFLAGFAKHELATEVGMRRGETLFALKQFVEAEKRFATAASVPQFALADHATMRQAGCRYEQQQYREAAKLYASIAAKFPQSRYLATASLASGKCAFLDGQYAEARSQLSKVPAQDPEAASEAAHWTARAWLKEGRASEALQAVDRVLPTATKTWKGQLALDRADALWELPPRRTESLVAYAAVAQDYAADAIAPQAKYMAAFAALTIGDHPAAIKHSSEFLQRFPKHELAVDVRYVQAETHLQRGEHDAAAKVYGELLVAAPQHRDAPTWHVRRALSLYLQKKYPEVSAQLSPVVTQLGGKELAAEAHYLVGSSQLELKLYDAAVKSLEASLQADAKWRQADETLLTLATALRQADRAPDARVQLEKLIRDFPMSLTLDRAHYRLGEILLAANQYDAAAAAYRKVIDGHPKSTLVPLSLYGLGWCHFRKQDYAGALKPLDDLNKQFATHEIVAPTRYLRALVRQELKQYDGAIDDLQAFLKSKPAAVEMANARYALGLALSSSGKADEAVQTFNSLLKDDPKYTGADKTLYELGWTLKNQQKDAEAAAAFERLAKEFPKSPLAAESWYHVGDFNFAKEKWTPAAKAYYASMNGSSDAGLAEKAAHKLGWAYFRNAEYVDAQQTFAYQRATHARGELAADATFMEAESLFKQNKYREALAIYAQLTAPPRKELAVLNALHAAQCCNALKEWSQTVPWTQRAQAADPATPYLGEILYEHAWSLQNQGQLDNAMKLYEEVTTRTDAEVAARARFMVGELLFEKKDHKEAVRNFFKVAYVYNYPAWQAAAQYESGRCFEVLGQLEQARKSYQEVVDKFPQSERAEPARKRLAELGKK